MTQKAPNTIGLARTAVPNGGKLFVTPVSTSESGVVSFRTYAAKVGDNGEISLRDVTKTLKSVPGTDLKHRGRPRKDQTLRAIGEGRIRPATVLGRQIASALYGEDGKLTVQEL